MNVRLWAVASSLIELENNGSYSLPHYYNVQHVLELSLNGVVALISDQTLGPADTENNMFLWGT